MPYSCVVRQSCRTTGRRFTCAWVDAVTPEKVRATLGHVMVQWHAYIGHSHHSALASSDTIGCQISLTTDTAQVAVSTIDSEVLFCA